MNRCMMKNAAITAAVLAGGLMLMPATARADHEERGRYGRHYRDHDRSRVHIDFRFGNRSPEYCPPTQHRKWVPGHYETVYEQVLVSPGHYDRIWHPPQYCTHYDSCGRPYHVLVSPGHYDQVWHAPQYETRAVKKWVPGRWVVVQAPGHYHQSRSDVAISGHVDF